MSSWRSKAVESLPPLPLKDTIQDAAQHVMLLTRSDTIEIGLNLLTFTYKNEAAKSRQQAEWRREVADMLSPGQMV